MGKDSLEELKKQLLDLRMKAILYSYEHKTTSPKLEVAIKKVKRDIASVIVNERKGDSKK